MFKSKALGTLTVQIPDQNNRYTWITETSIPLLEGGLLYSGVLSPVNDSRSAETQILVNDDLRKYTFTKKMAEGKYEVGIGLPFPEKTIEITLFTHSDNNQSFYGVAKDLRTGKTYKFTYLDVNEPLTTGTVVIIAAGVAAIAGAIVDIVGMIANWQCKKVKVNYGLNFSWQKKELDIGCSVDCVEK